MVRKLLLLTLCTLSGILAVAQTSLGGKVLDDAGDGAVLANVAVYKNGNLITGTQTDFDGNYTVTPIDPGTYDVEFSLVGAQPTRVEGVVVFAGKANKLDATLTSGINLEEVVVVGYEVPLIEQDNTTQGATITSDQIKNLPTRNINALAATSAGLSSSDEGGAISVRGSRSDATDYYIDGMRVTGTLVPESEIDQLQVITGGIEAQYGDVTGGIISITTKGPSAKWSGGVEVETSEFFDAYDNRLAGFNVSGPLLKNKDGQSILGMRLAGRYTYQKDDDPSAVDLFRVNDATLAELEANPIIQRTNANGTISNFLAADFTTQDDVNTIKARPFEENTRYDFTAKLDARLSKAIDVTLSGSFRDQANQFTPGSVGDGNSWAVFNAHNNPISKNQNLRANFRFRHRLGGAGVEEGADKASAIQNASYTLQFSYENNLGDLSDPRHGDNYFAYGHVGVFDVEWVPTFTFDFQSGTLVHTDYLEVLRGYTPGTSNPVLANYNNTLNLTEGEALNADIGDSQLTGGPGGGGASIGIDNFIGRNGELSDQFDNSWGFHTNVGWVYNFARQFDDDIVTANINSSFDLVPNGDANKGRHNIQFGVLYEQRTNRRYAVEPRNLWNVARQQANAHIQGIPENPDSIDVMEVFNPIIGALDTATIYALDISESADNLFYLRVREALAAARGTDVPLTEYVNVDGLDPSFLSLDMFSAKELNDQQLLSYYGYDYLGNEFDGTFDDFFTAEDANGVRTFPVAPNRPIYFAGYIQDKFTFKDIIFRLGLRVDRYDANTRVLKDNYSLYEIQGASDFHASNPELERPGSIGDDFKVYANESGTAVQGYRDGDDWYFANGAPANNPALIFPGGLVFPAYTDPRVSEQGGNFIKSREFDPNVSFEDYEPQINYMPRLAFSFPISDDANFFAHYDILVQRPPSNTIATARDYFYFTDVDVVRSNPNLKPERTVDYEVGFQQRLSASSSLKLSAYYKEMRDMIQRRTFFPVPIVNQYTTFDNLDFGTVKGFSLAYDLRRTGNASLQANYTLQFADGTGSDANSQRGLTSRGNIRNLLPLSFDERHRLVASLDYRYGSGKLYNGPKVAGNDILANFGVNFQAIAVSGRPYTATIQSTELGGTGFKGAINGARRPWNYTLNLRVDKSFTLGKGLNFNAYVRVSNLLDRRNILGVYSASGSATDDGFLASSDGNAVQSGIENSTRELQSYLASYQWSILNPDFFSLPRRVFAGVIFDF